VAFFALHSFTPHKELRFLLPMVPVLCALAGAGLGVIETQLHRQAATFAAGALALTALISGLRAGSLTFGQLGAYEKERPASSAWGDFADVNQLLLAASRQLDVCGLKMEAVHQAWTGGSTYLHQPVPYYVHAQYDLKPYSMFGIVFPQVKRHFDPFVGVVAFALAILGIATFWRDHRARMVGAVGLGALVYSLGNNSVFQGFLYAAVPDLDKARTPSAAVAVFAFAIAVLAAFGMDRLSSPEPSPWLRRTMLGLLGFGVVTLVICQGVVFFRDLQFPDEGRVVLTAIVAVALAALFYGYRHASLTRASGNALLALLLLLELGNNSGYELANRSDQGREKWLTRLRANRDIAEFLKRQPGHPRIDVAGDAFAQNWGAWNGLEMRLGALAGVTKNVLESEFFSDSGRLIYGVAYTISATPPPPGAGRDVFTGASGLKVYQRDDAFPRAWAVHKLVQIPERGVGNVMIGERLPEFRNMAVMETPPPKLEACEGDRVRVVEHLPDRVAIEAGMNCTGMVVLADTYFPGWRARVDGQRVSIHQVNNAFRGVVVPRGKHVITMRHRPASLILGAFLTLLGLAGAVLAAVWSRREKDLQIT
jgi:hypothetical protein